MQQRKCYFMGFTGIIDYGMGNLLSVSKALTAAGGEIRIVSSPGELAGADRIVLPGVGNFGDGMAHLRASGFIPLIRTWIREDRPFLGICLGMQMLLERSEEAPGETGLGIIPGEVIRFPDRHEKVPHIGWNTVERNPDHSGKFFEGMKNINWFYFVHSYYVKPADPAWIVASCRYILTFTAALSRGNLLAVQFHPEKSQNAGLCLLEQFFRQTKQ